MIAVLTTPEYDTSGVVELPVVNDAGFVPMTRRVSRTKTLDGSAVINDGGYSEADRTIRLRWTADAESLDQAVARLLQQNALLNVALRDGVYQAAPESFTPGASESELQLLVLSKLSA